MTLGGRLFAIVIGAMAIVRFVQGHYLHASMNIIGILIVILAVWIARRGYFRIGGWMLAIPTVGLSFLCQFFVMETVHATPLIALCMMSLMLMFPNVYSRLGYVVFCTVLLAVSVVRVDGDLSHTVIFVCETSSFAALFLLYAHFFEKQDTKLALTIGQLKTSFDRKEQANHELQERVEDLIGFSHIMSHDLKGPLFSIRGYAELVRMDVQGNRTNKETEENLSAIIESVDSMSSLISDLLTYSKISLADCVSEKVDLDPLVDETVGLLQFQIQKDGVQIEKGNLSSILVNAELFKTVLYNLFSNAIKYQPKDQPHHVPTLRVWSEEDDETVSLFIKDNGVGIDHAYLPDLFVPFRRDRGGSYEGTGLGMSITEGIVEKFNGTIDVAETGPSGTTFQLVFPHPQTLSPLSPADDLPAAQTPSAIGPVA